MAGLQPMRPMPSHGPQPPAIDPDALTDAELLAVSEDDAADLSLLTAEEQKRLSTLKTEKKPPLVPGASGDAYAQSRNDKIGYLQEMAHNIGPSVGKAVTDAINALPALADMASELTPSGMSRRLMSGEPSKIAQVPGALLGRYGERYGTPEARALTVRDDPAGMVGDVAAAVAPVKAVASSAVSGLRSAAKVAGPMLKSPAADLALTFVGIPHGTRRVAKAAVGLMNRSTPAVEAAPAVAAPVSPAASVPEAVAPPVAPVVHAPVETPIAAPPPSPPAAPAVTSQAGDTIALPWANRTKGQQSPSWVRSDLGIAARRSNATLTEPQYAEAADLVKAGRSPVDAVAEIAGRPTDPLAVGLADVERLKLSPDETKAYVQLLTNGKTHQEAIAAIEQQRKFSGLFGTPSPEAVRRTVAGRNATGKWPKP